MTVDEFIVVLQQLPEDVRKLTVYSADGSVVSAARLDERADFTTTHVPVMKNVRAFVNGIETEVQVPDIEQHRTYISGVVIE